ncbi:Catechol 2,3-dioxygenase [Enhydrobacter aerosaccus]|uniref:Catechol 2,3-dioxygenase n=1 Tax=Enhydrobacter aerosaccus TaxID=225324 RepID=A0A1T4LLI6_9HYPH|nr:VOC family protein [Enhydrobacter aerosaccus]SJZ55583.1 Catechol 2,3-dioxygenase [Enhydrobacter aerosaccus]
MSIAVERIDHIVINCRDVEATAAWYERVLGMAREVFGPERRVALKFGQQKFNVRQTGTANWWTAENDVPGSLDLCFVTRQSPQEVIGHLRTCGVEVAQGPVTKTGALGPMTSVYCRDPDGNLIEISTYA